MAVIEIEDSDDDGDNGDSDEEMGPVPQPTTPELPLAPQVGGPLNVAFIDVPATSDAIEEPKSASIDGMIPASSASSDTAGAPKPGPSNETTRSPSHPGDGWYVVYHAVLPSVCYGV